MEPQRGSILSRSHPGLIGREANWPAIPTDGAHRAAELINQLARDRDSRSAGSGPPRNATTVAPM